MLELVIYSKDNCPNCTTAIAMAKSKALNYQVRKLDIDYTKDDILEISGGTAKSLPQFVYDGKYLGDYKTFLNWIKQ